NTNTNNGNTGFMAEGGTNGTNSWTNPTNAATANSTYTTATTNNSAQQWKTFGLQGTGGVPNDPPLVVDGLQVQLKNVFLTGSGASTNCTLKVEVSWNGGGTTGNWSTAVTSATLATTPTTTVLTLGSNSSTSAWGSHSWAYADFSNNNFVV